MQIGNHKQTIQARQEANPKLQRGAPPKNLHLDQCFNM